MKIVFEDKSYLDISKSNNPNMIIVSIGVKNSENQLSVNSAEISKDKLLELINSLNG